jgi:uncharacterized glyoxalase superfamily protein PhnB
MSAHFDAIGVVVADMTESLAFYRLLGLDIPSSADQEGHVEVTLPGGIRLMFDTEAVMRSFDENWARPSHPGPIGFAFLCDGPSDVDSTFQLVVDAGYEPVRPPWDAFWGQRYATVRDPDGSMVDLFARLEG